MSTATSARSKIQGVDLQGGWRPIDMLTLSGSVSYNDSELQENVPLTAATFSPTKGKQLGRDAGVDLSRCAPTSTSAAFMRGIQGKYVDERPSTDTNDEFAPSYVVWIWMRATRSRWACSRNSRRS